MERSSTIERERHELHPVSPMVYQMQKVHWDIFGWLETEPRTYEPSKQIELLHTWPNCLDGYFKTFKTQYAIL